MAQKRRDKKRWSTAHAVSFLFSFFLSLEDRNKNKNKRGGRYDDVDHSMLSNSA